MTQAAASKFGLAGSSNYGQYYRHSGQINVGGIVAALVLGSIAGAILAGVYSAAVVFVPFVKLRGIACIFYGIALGAVPASLLKKFKVRNVPVSMAVVGVVTLISFYIAWGSWEVMVLRNVDPAPSALKIMTNPRIVYNIAQIVYDMGTWNIGGNSGDDAVKGNLLLGIWVLEAAFIFGSSLLTVRSMLGKTPFCEKCDQWCSDAKTVRLTTPIDVKTLKSKLESGDFAFVASLPVPTGSGVFTFTQHQCEKCKELNTLSVISRTLRKDKKGRVRSSKPTTIINKLMVNLDDLQKLMPVTPVVGVAAAPAPIAPKPVVTAPVKKPMKSPQTL